MDASGVVKNGVLNAMLPLFREALQTGQKQRASEIAMHAAESLLARHPEQSREALWNTFFSKLRQLPRYQAYDFEIADYQLYDALPGPMLFRGPPPDYLSLATGRFVTLLGAAQLFGRFQPVAPHVIVEKRANIACLNLSMSGAGPESFLTPDVLAVARRGRAVVLQVLSGRSVGCDEYPGLGVTHRKNDGSKAKRLAILREVRQQSREEAVRLVAKWQLRYVELMQQLIADLRVPVLLVWISARSPDDWSMSELGRGGNFGDFPHLVERSMVEAIAAGAAKYLEISGDPDLPHAFESRFGTGKCPRFSSGGKLAWENPYYPSPQLSRGAAEAVGNALSTLI